jgi:Holliday junction resolvase
VILISKAKGSRAERELLHMFWEHHFWCIRVAGSGSMPLPCPDLLAGKKGKSLAVECKSSKADRIYIEPKQIEELQAFAKGFGAESWIGVRFNNMDWYFVHPKNLGRNGGKKFFVSKDLAVEKGISFAKFINER